MAERSDDTRQPEHDPARTEDAVVERLRDLEQRVTSSMERAVRGFQEEVADRVRRGTQVLIQEVQDIAPALPGSLFDPAEVSAVTAEASAGRRAVDRIFDGIAHIDGARSQSEVLGALIEEARRFASRSAFVLIRADQCRVWGAQGFGAATESISGRALPADADSPFVRLASSGSVARFDASGCAEIAALLDVEAGVEGVLIPFLVRNRLGGSLYADRLDEDRVFDLTSLRLLTHAAAQAVETLPFRDRRSATLADGAGAVAMWREDGESEEAVTSGVVAASMATAAAATTAAAAVIATAAVSDSDSESDPASTEVDLVETHESVAAEVSVEPDPAPVPDVSDSAIAGLPEIDQLATSDVPIVGHQIPDAPVADEPPPVEMASAPIEAEPAVAELEVASTEVASTELETTEEATDYGFAVDAPEAAPVAEMAPATEPEPRPATLESTGSIEFEAVEPQVEGGDEEFELVAEPETPAATAPAAADDDIWDEDDPTTTGSVAAPVESADPGALQTVRLDVASLRQQMADQAATAPEVAPTPETPELELDTAPPAEAPPPAIATATPEVSETPEFELDTEAAGMAPPPAAIPEPVAPEPVAPAPVVEPPSPTPEPAAPAGTTEVRPPDDLRGPGSAFGGDSGGRMADEEALHEEARRLARLLVSEIKLYNEEVIEEGRRGGNIYARLKEDIDRSRQMYEERIDPRVSEREDYFHQELVQRLAGGDASILGL